MTTTDTKIVNPQTLGNIQGAIGEVLGMAAYLKCGGHNGKEFVDARIAVEAFNRIVPLNRFVDGPPTIGDVTKYVLANLREAIKMLETP